jgi:hypothetical protein
MFWYFISSLPVKRGGSLSFLTIFTFCRSRVIGFDMTEKRIFTLCRMITWVVFLRMFWNFISSIPVKRGGSLSFLVGTITNVLVMEIGWTDVESEVYILVSCAHSNTSWFLVFNPTFSNISAISWRPVLVVEEAEYPERTTDHGQATGKLYHLRLRFECTLFLSSPGL